MGSFPTIAFAKDWRNIVYWVRSAEAYRLQPEICQLPHAFPVGVEAVHGGEAFMEGGDVGGLIPKPGGGLQNSLRTFTVITL